MMRCNGNTEFSVSFFVHFFLIRVHARNAKKNRKCPKRLPTYTPTALNDADSDADNTDSDSSSDIALLDPSSESRLRRSLRFMPSKYWRSYKCKAEFMKRWNSRLMLSGYIDRNPGMCNFCSVDDDVLGMVRELTLDRLVGTVAADEEQDSSSLEENNPLHGAFEKDVCLELRKINHAYPSFERSEGCKIVFHCRRAEKEELDEELESELAIVDHRDVGEGNDDKLLYSVTTSP
jgi:hypothetical protein